MKESKVKYLVRKLKLIDGGIVSFHSLVYFEGISVADVKGKYRDIKLTEFDRERPGVSFIDELEVVLS